jgi:nucleotide-binding universal stress UspA family protein
VEIGLPSEVILETVENLGADLVVIANKGRGNLARVLFGSVAEKVLRHSKATVVSVRDRENFKRSE